MIRRHITRTLTRATITAFVVKMVDSLPVVEKLEPVNAWGELTEKEAKKAVKDAHGIADATIGNIEYVKETYKIAIDKFVENAEMVDISEADEDEEETENE